MSPSEIVWDLKCYDPVSFERLAPQTLGAWIDRSGDKPQWSARTLAYVQKGYRPGGETTRIGVLIKCPEATTSTIKTLSNLRACGVPLTLTSIQGILIGKLRFMALEIFTTLSPDRTLFMCSDDFTKKFDFLIPQGMSQASDISKAFVYADSITLGCDIMEHLYDLSPKGFRDDGCIRTYSTAYSKKYQRIVLRLFKEGVVQILICTDAAGMVCLTSQHYHHYCTNTTRSSGLKMCDLF